MRAPRTYLDPTMLDQARRLEAMTQSVRTLLPPGLRDHCWVGNIKDGVLVLVTDSGTWAHPLRYMQREVLKQMKAHHGISARSIKIRVRPVMQAFMPRPGKPLPPLNEDAREALSRAADSVEDPELRETLRRFATQG